MSVDSAALERSALERKDREELLTIAKALGGKPGSRAKKADIIDVILELTGVGGPAADEPKQDSGAKQASGAKQDAKSGAEADAVAGAEPPGRGERRSEESRGGTDAAGIWDQGGSRAPQKTK